MILKSQSPATAHSYLPVCLVGELKNITCDVANDFDLNFEFDNTFGEDDYQHDPASHPELSPTRVQTLLGLVVMLFVVWFSVTRGLAQQGNSQVALVSLFISVGFIIRVLNYFLSAALQCRRTGDFRPGCPAAENGFIGTSKY